MDITIYINSLLGLLLFLSRVVYMSCMLGVNRITHMI